MGRAYERPFLFQRQCPIFGDSIPNERLSEDTRHGDSLGNFGHFVGIAKTYESNNMFGNIIPRSPQTQKRPRVASSRVEFGQQRFIDFGFYGTTVQTNDFRDPFVATMLAVQSRAISTDKLVRRKLVGLESV